jgi:hypothetical protein
VRRRSDRGAAAVEFALVSIFLIPLLLGMLDYGIWFSNSLAARDGARAAARLGALGQFGPDCTTDYLSATDLGANVSTDLKALACTAAQQTSPLVGGVYVRIRLIDGSGVETTWNAPPVAIRVCIAVKYASTIGVPIPNGGLVVAKVQMALESQHQLTSMPEGGGYTRGAPTDWTWC